ncbi:hypothetical protein [Kribbella sp. NPDC051770]|uniref:hypothetical protein n=1 Tax=Kribbella sp. NPDC051770 TaxID=3155413 RepID=UPI003442E32C
MPTEQSAPAEHSVPACAATDLWDDANWDTLTRRHLDAIRSIGALSVLPVALNSRIIYGGRTDRRRSRLPALLGR